jgi:hypothetical protein
MVGTGNLFSSGRKTAGEGTIRQKENPLRIFLFN